ncbi:hypothetical protein AAVH_41334 [Aphelenchoides avenae]|nr:hypothetical protein AAVH_41334 [Aphelenchus avenae]
MYVNPEDPTVFTFKNFHLHDGAPSEIEAKKEVQKMRKRASETVELPSQIIQRSLPTKSPAVKAALPKKTSIASLISRDRTRDNKAPANPLKRENIVIPAAYAEYSSDGQVKENFVLVDTGADEQDPSRIIIFGRASTEEWAGTVKDLYVDGTFKAAPALFSQMFVVLGGRGDYIWPNLEPDSVSCDFEAAVMTAAERVFNDIEIHGCLFHLAHNLWKCIAREKLSTKYNSDAEFQLFARMILALAFLPISQLPRGVRWLTENLPEELEPVLSYFGKPLFEPHKWSVFRRTRLGLRRTNNNAEAFHRQLYVLLQTDHPSIWRFIDDLKRVQSLSDLQYERFVMGEAAPTKRKKHLETDKRLLHLVETCEQRNPAEFLRGIAENLSFK